MERKNLVILALSTLVVVFFAIFLTSKPIVLEVDPQYDTQHYVRMLDIYSTFDDEEIQNSDVYYTDEHMIFNTVPMTYHGYEMRIVKENLDGELEVVFLNRETRTSQWPLLPMENTTNISWLMVNSILLMTYYLTWLSTKLSKNPSPYLSG